MVKITNIHKDKPEAIAEAVGVFSDTNHDVSSDATRSGENRSLLRKVALGGGAVAAAAFLLLPRGGNELPPKPAPTYEELAAQSAQTPYDPATEADKLMIDGIKVNSDDKNSHNNTPSQAVMDASKVFLKQYPEEFTSLYSSATSLPDGATEIVVVNRDINGDGKPDAIAAPVDEDR